LAGPKRQTTWVGPALQSFQAVSTASKVILASFDPAAAALTKPTIVRTRGILSVVPFAFTADLNHTGALGIGIVTDRAFAAGAASIPGPFTDSGWDGWLATQFFSFRFEVISGDGVVWLPYTVEVDSKAMRKVTDDETVVVMYESFLGAVNVDAPIRQLFKLA